MFILFGKSGCEMCHVVKRILKTQGVDYTYNEIGSLMKAQLICGEEYEEDILGIKEFPFGFVDGTIMDIQKLKERVIEPVLYPNQRYTLFPIQYHDIYTLYKKSRASFWQPEEVDLSKDYEDLEKMSDSSKRFLYYVLAFFASADGIVLENLGSRFIQEVKVEESVAFYGMQTGIEAIHSEMYSLLIDAYVKDSNEKQRLFNGIENIPSIKNKGKWAQKWLSSNRSFAERLVAFACVEGIMFSGSFCAIFWLKKQGLMPGLSFANELISRDEGLHTEHAVMLYKHLKFPLDQKAVYEIVMESVENEKQFIIESLDCKLIGMNANLMSEYIEFIADVLVKSLGYDAIYNVSCPFDFMENISLNGKTNFFEKRVGEYAKAGVMTDNTQVFEFEDDF